MSRKKYTYLLEVFFCRNITDFQKSEGGQEIYFEFNLFRKKEKKTLTRKNETDIVDIIV